MAPQVTWIKVPRGEHNTEAGMRMLGAHTDAEFAEWGRWCLLRSILSETERGRIDLTDDKMLQTLMFNFRLSTEETMKFIERLISLGLLQRDVVGSRVEIFNIDVENSINAYKTIVKRNKNNGKKGGRPTEKT